MHPGSSPRRCDGNPRQSGVVSLPLIVPSSPRHVGGGLPPTTQSPLHSEEGGSGSKKKKKIPSNTTSARSGPINRNTDVMLDVDGDQGGMPRSVAARLHALSARGPERVRELVPAPPPQSGGKGETNALVLVSANEDVDFADLMPREGPRETGLQARRAFRALAADYKQQLAAKDNEIQALRESAASTSPGGLQFIRLQDELEWTQGELRGAQAKVASLVKLLDRAGATIRASEERKEGGAHRGSLSNFSDSAGGDHSGSSRINWSPLAVHMKDLLVHGRSDNQIVVVVAQYLQKLINQVGALETVSEGNSSKVTEMEHRREALMRTVQQQQREIEDLKDELLLLRRGGGGGPASSDGSSGESATIAALRQEFEQERAKLLLQVTNLETAMRRNVDTRRPYFVALGKGLAVPPFLRFDGRIKNVPLSKPVVENIINALWLTRFLPTVGECSAFEEAGLTPDVRRRGSKAVLEALEKATILSSALEKTFTRNCGDGGGGGASRGRGAGGAEDVVNLADGDDRGTVDRFSLGQRGRGGLTNSGDGSGERGLVDYDNLALWTIRRADARKLLSFGDHLARFFVELFRPDRISALFSFYNTGEEQTRSMKSQSRGVATPPVAEVARCLRARLLLCAPQATTLMRSAVAMPPEVAEVTYALMDGCDRFSFDADVELFRRVVKGQLPESAFFDQMLMLQKLRVSLMRSAVAEREDIREAAGIKKEGTSEELRKEVSFAAASAAAAASADVDDDIDGDERSSNTIGSILRAIRKFFPSKSADEFRLLQRALLLDVGAISLNGGSDTDGTNNIIRAKMVAPSPSSVADGSGSPPRRVQIGVGGLEGMGAVSPAHLALEVDVRRLFESSDSGNQGYFIEGVRNQHLEGLATYMAEVQCAILSLGSERGKGSSPAEHPQGQQPPQVPLLLIRDKLSEIDPMKPRTDVNDYLFHLLQLMFAERVRLGSPDADLVHRGRDEWFEPPLCYHPIHIEELARYCPLVICKRCGPPSGNAKRTAAATL